jgi:hypothetical protein
MAASALLPLLAVRSALDSRLGARKWTGEGTQESDLIWRLCE